MSEFFGFQMWNLNVGTFVISTQGHYEVIWGHNVIWGHMRSYEGIRGHMRSYEGIWGHMRSFSKYIHALQRWALYFYSYLGQGWGRHRYWVTSSVLFGEILNFEKPLLRKNTWFILNYRNYSGYNDQICLIKGLKA